VNRLNTELLQILKEPTFKTMMTNNGMEPIGSTPEALTIYIQKEIVKWTKVVKSAGLKAE
jgi:tripartite-type tricarboxylate transporter receptor subunit TctC